MKKSSNRTRIERQADFKQAGHVTEPVVTGVLTKIPAVRDSLFWYDFLMLAGFTLLGLAMRLYNLGYRQPTLDELFNMRMVRAPLFKDFLQALMNVDSHPPLSYLIQKLFYALNPDLYSVRLSSALIGTLAVPAIFWAFRPILGKRISLAASFLAATSYILIWYSREARNYALFFTLSVLVVGYFIRLLMQGAPRGHFRNLFGFTLCMMLCLYVHHTSFLILPILGSIYVIWEAAHRTFRRRLAVQLTVSILILGLSSIPLLYQLQAWSFDHFATESTRPSLSQLTGILASIGWGKGWRMGVWSVVLLGGVYSIRRHSREAALIFVSWILVPLAGYLLLFGMAQKFMWYFYRYAIFIQIGLFALVAACLIQLAQQLDRARIANRRVLRFGVVLTLLVTVRLAVLWEPFTTFYQMKASGLNRGELLAAFRSVPYRRILPDNFYWVDTALREYKPKDVHAAYPPVFNNMEEYRKFKVAAFIRESCHKDPLLGFFETGTRFFAKADTSWSWIERHFAREAPLFNEEGYELAKIGLNYFSYLDVSAYFRFRLNYNTLENLPEWYRRRGRTLGVGYTEGWMPISICSTIWQMWYGMEQEAGLYLYNGGTNAMAAISFDVQTCAASQHLSIEQGSNQVFDLELKIPAPIVHFLNGDPPVQAFVTFPELIRSNEGIMPYFAGFQFTSGHATSRPFMVPPGLSFLRVCSTDKTGILITNLKIEEAADPAGPPP